MAGKNHRIIYDLTILEIENRLIFIKICELYIFCCRINGSDTYVAAYQLNI